ncbi:hypothetical protein [uncultured Algibacter sp.]|uniref:hypothetical protein n=1 Tax=uncultured Algibacter sp. TaxID=298659 RepID=UPI00261679B8|nr:hypothetical protein [uncultured Algibacter sp.]
MKTILKISFLFLCITLSCSSNNDIVDEIIDDSKINTDNSFFAKVNGIDFNSSEKFVGASIAYSPGASGLAIIATQVENISSSKAIGITLSVVEDNFEFKNGMVFTPTDSNIFLIGVYRELANEDYEFVENVSIRLEITNIDKVNKLISGKFNFIEISKDEIGNEKTYTVTDGIFKGISYTDD